MVAESGEVIAQTSATATPDTMGGRIIAVLDALASDPKREWGVRELATAIGASRSTINRALQGFVEAGMASVGPRSLYQAGPRLHVLAARLHAAHPLLSPGRSIVEELARETDGTVLLVVHAAPLAAAVVLQVVQRPGPVKYSLRPGDLLPLHAGAAGRAVLGISGMESIAGRNLEAMTDATPTDHENVAARIAEDLRRGYVLSSGQLFPSASGVAVGFQSHGGMAAAVSVTRPRHLTRPDDTESEVAQIRSALSRLQQLAREAPVTPTETEGLPTFGNGSTAVERTARLVGATMSFPMGVPTARRLGPHLGAGYSTTLKLTHLAHETGLVRPAHDRWRVGPLPLRWAARIGPHAPLAEVAEAVLAQLGTKFGETVGLAEYRPGETTARMTAVVAGARPMDYSLRAGVDIPLYAGAAGKAILAHCTPDTVDAQQITPLTPDTVRTKDDLQRDLAQIRSQGYAMGIGERIPDAFGVSAPFFHQNTIAGSVTVTIPRTRAVNLDPELLATAVINAARSIERLI